MAEETKEIALSEVKDGKLRIAIAYTGDRFNQHGNTFTVTERDLHSIAAHMADRETPIDYEHMSAANVPPGWSKAAGWIAATAGVVEDFGDGRKVLWGWFEPTPACLSSIRTKEYRYFSPEIHWNDTDEHGKPIGTRLKAGAITNRPFLKDLPPIEVAPADFPQLLEAVALSESKRLVDINAVHVAAEINSEKEKKAMAAKKLTFKKLSDGDDKGKIGIFSDSEMVGMCDRAAMKAYMAEDPDDDEGGKDTPVKLREVAIVACFSELAKAKDGKEVVMLTDKFVDEGKFETRELRRAQKIEALVSEGIAKGKILSKQRAAFFSMAVADYDNAVIFMSEQKPVVDLKAHGIEGDGEGTRDAKEEMETRIVAYMTDKKVDRIAAFREIARQDPALYERSKNQQPVTADRG